MKLEAEAETEIFLNDEGGVTVTQYETGSFNMIYVGSADRVRAIANEMLRLAAAIDAGDAGEEI